MNERELKEAVREVYAVTGSTPLVDRSMRDAYASLGEAPARKRSAGKRVLKWAAGAAGGLAATFAVLVGVGFANPALAAGVPFLGNIVEFLRGGHSVDAMVHQGTVGEYVQPVVSGQAAENRQFQIKDAYFDGEVLFLTTQMDLGGAPEEYRVLQPDFELTFTADGETLDPDYRWRRGRGIEMARASDTTYVGTMTLYLKDDVLPDSFDLSVKVTDLKAVDTKHMVKSSLGFGDYVEKTYDLPAGQVFSCTIHRDDSLRKVYEVNETKNGCTLESVTVTPAVTEIQIGEDTGINPETGNPVIMFAYDGDGEPLEIIGQVGDYHHQFFRTLDKDETNVTVRFIDKNDKQNVVAEFVVPVEGGWYEEQPETPWEDDGIPVVYDPPLEENSQGASQIQPENLANFGDRLSTCGMNVVFDNLRYFDTWEEAGLTEEDMNLSQYEKEHPEEFDFVMFDVTAETPSTVTEADEDITAADKQKGDAVYWISSVLYPCAVDGNYDGNLYGEIAYFSHHGIGLSDYYHFAMGPNETQTMQVGLMVPKTQLESGNLQIVIGGEGSSGPACPAILIPPSGE